ncbi:MAG TPA: 4-hydroxy-tetrahydrodipicolinate reductase [Alphaproteobacteria bacterium]|nr:4-hydroxy-tetrahydrodipicolinate reductase [Alphaproteobacteria bacterium]
MKIGIIGCTGRMGQALVREVLATPGCTLAGATVRPGSAARGQDVGSLCGAGAAGLAATDDPVPLIAAADAVIDFTTPESSVRLAALCAQAQTALVVGTTGLDEMQEAVLHTAARHAPVVYAANTSVGVTLLQALVEQVAATLGPDEFDIEIVEMHHRMKVDAPSGTALALGRAAARGRGVDLAHVQRRARDGHTGLRPAGEIGFAVLRGGDVAGEHTVLFAGANERIELTHKATDRRIFARGAVRAALWAAAQPAGLYGMRDVLGL